MSKKVPILGWVSAGEKALKVLLNLIPNAKQFLNRPWGDPRIRFRRVEIRPGLLLIELEMV